MIPGGSGRRSSTADGAPHLAMSSLTPETQTCLQGINRFLEDIYGHPRPLTSAQEAALAL